MWHEQAVAQEILETVSYWLEPASRRQRGLACNPHLADPPAAFSISNGKWANPRFYSHPVPENVSVLK